MFMCIICLLTKSGYTERYRPLQFRNINILRKCTYVAYDENRKLHYLLNRAVAIPPRSCIYITLPCHSSLGFIVILHSWRFIYMIKRPDAAVTRHCKLLRLSANPKYARAMPPDNCYGAFTSLPRLSSRQRFPLLSRTNLHVRACNTRLFRIETYAYFSVNCSWKLVSPIEHGLTKQISHRAKCAHELLIIPVPPDSCNDSGLMALSFWYSWDSEGSWIHKTSSFLG